ncbi:hypothetical protein [Micromonospora sp. DT62]|uniref:hypothetical protein n=1 Tax=Micromonospora sp. DT62 TaxID=3416521 RepID=UPI003CF8814E
MTSGWFADRVAGLRADAVEAEAARAVAMLDAVAASGRLNAPVVADFERYDDAVREIAAVVSRQCLVADQYPTMGAFWADIAAQERGESTGTFWDTYDHGRRRLLERLLAQAYGSADAVLVNSGMAAVYCAAVCATDHGRRRLQLPARRYFETHDLVTNVPLGQAVDPSLEGVGFLEPITNCPTLDVNEPATLGEGLGRFVVDNSMWSHAFPFEQVRTWISGRPLLVVESLAKYLSGLVSGGVVYGDRDMVEAVRVFARRTGQLLQGSALAYLSPTDIRLAGRRVRHHVETGGTFADHVDKSRWSLLSPDAELIRRAGLPAMLGTGSLVFLRARDPGTDCAAVVDRWIAATAGGAHPVRLQAGFGWPWTSTRSYGSDHLNQPDGPRYIRVSVGAIDQVAAKEQAMLLNEVSG